MQGLGQSGHKAAGCHPSAPSWSMGDQYLFIDAQGVRGGKVATFFLYQDTLVDLCKKVLERLGYTVEKVSGVEKEAGHQN